jgi:hypothetical protein
MKLDFLNQVYKKLLGYFLLIFFCGYLSSITFFPHTHIVDGVTIVHSHPNKSHSGNVPHNHSHSKNGFLLIQFISHFIATAPFLFFGIKIIRKALNIRILIPGTNLNFSLYHFSAHRPRAPNLYLHNKAFFREV